MLHEPSPCTTLLVPQHVSAKINVRRRYRTKSRMTCSRGRENETRENHFSDIIPETKVAEAVVVVVLVVEVVVVVAADKQGTVFCLEFFVVFFRSCR